MTVRDWVAARADDVPAALLAGVHEALGPAADRPAADAADVLLESAERRLSALLPSGASERDGALPLLTIDVLITFALEAAADRPEELETRARRAVLSLSTLSGACP